MKPRLFDGAARNIYPELLGRRNGAQQKALSATEIEVTHGVLATNEGGNEVDELGVPPHQIFPSIRSGFVEIVVKPCDVSIAIGDPGTRKEGRGLLRQICFKTASLAPPLRETDFAGRTHIRERDTRFFGAPSALVNRGSRAYQ